MHFHGQSNSLPDRDGCLARHFCEVSLYVDPRAKLTTHDGGLHASTLNWIYNFSAAAAH
jgi:hypothetical protein